MRKLFTIIIFTASLWACKTKINTPISNTIAPMEKFDIETFNKNKNPSNEWYIETEDIEIKRLYDSNDLVYVEITTHKKEYYSDFKKYYSNGNLKERGKCYDNNNSFFSVAIWEYYDIDGKLIKTVDEDQVLKINYKKALEIARKEYGLSIKDVEIFHQSGEWYISNVKGRHIGRGVIINSSTGKHKALIMRIGGQ